MILQLPIITVQYHPLTLYAFLVMYFQIHIFVYLFRRLHVVIFDLYCTGAFSGGGSEKVMVEFEPPGGWQQSEDLREENGERLAFERLK